MKARLHPLGNGRYSILFDGKLLVDRSCDPECDAARALLVRGYKGTLQMLDGKTGKPRTIIDIERAARLCVKEGPLRFAPYESHPDQAYSPETDTGGSPGAGGGGLGLCRKVEKKVQDPVEYGRGSGASSAKAEKPGC